MRRYPAVYASLLALTLATSGCGYNTIQTLDERVNRAQGDIQTQLQRRADLIPNLVETVKGVTKQEDTVFISIANARARLSGAVTAGVAGSFGALEASWFVFEQAANPRTAAASASFFMGPTVQ